MITVGGFGEGSLVVLHLVQPTEKLWGVLLDLGVAGVTFRGINLSSFDDWMFQISRREEVPSLGLGTMFVPMGRVERIFLDEAIGAVESYRERFERRVGESIEPYLGLGPTAATPTEPLPS